MLQLTLSSFETTHAAAFLGPQGRSKLLYPMQNFETTHADFANPYTSLKLPMQGSETANGHNTETTYTKF